MASVQPEPTPNPGPCPVLHAACLISRKQHDSCLLECHGCSLCRRARGTQVKIHGLGSSRIPHLALSAEPASICRDGGGDRCPQHRVRGGWRAALRGLAFLFSTANSNTIGRAPPEGQSHSHRAWWPIGNSTSSNKEYLCIFPNF